MILFDCHLCWDWILDSEKYREPHLHVSVLNGLSGKYADNYLGAAEMRKVQFVLSQRQ